MFNISNSLTIKCQYIFIFLEFVALGIRFCANFLERYLRYPNPNIIFTSISPDGKITFSEITLGFTLA